MSVQPDPTLTSICTEGWKKSGTTPTATELVRAKDEFFQEILNDIWLRTVRSGNSRLKSLQTTSYFNVVAGQNYIDVGEDMDEEFTVTLLNGTVRGTAQAGGASSITLAASDGMSAARALGKPIFLTGGLGTGQLRRITLYDSTTKIATITPAWTTVPDVTTTYLVVENPLLLDEENQLDADLYIPSPAGWPSFFSKYGTQLLFDRSFDLSTYGIQLRHYKNLMQIDMVEGAGTLISRLLRNWQAVLKEGIAWKVMQSQNDNQQVVTMQKYEQLAAALLAKEIPYGGEFTGFVL